MTMRTLGVAALFIVALTTGCDWFGSGGGGSSPSQPGPGPGPAPIDDGAFNNLSSSVITDVRDDFQKAESASDPTLWLNLSGWKLYQIVNRHVSLPDNFFDDERNARVFVRLYRELTEADGSVKSSVDGRAVIRELKNEYLKKGSL